MYCCFRSTIEHEHQIGPRYLENKNVFENREKEKKSNADRRKRHTESQADIFIGSNAHFYFSHFALNAVTCIRGASALQASHSIVKIES